MTHNDPWLRELRDARARVRRRWQHALSQAHAPERGASESGVPPQVPWARQHPRWAPLLGGDGTRDAEALANNMASMQLAKDSDAQHRRDELEDRDAVPVDYHQCYLDSGLRDLPASWVQNPGLETRFVEHPRLHRLLEAKREMVERLATPATYLQTDLRASLPDTAHESPSFRLHDLLPIKYDVIIVDPPLAAYDWDLPCESPEPHPWSWEELAALPIARIAAKESFIFLWVGSGANNGLERGREVLAHWGYRRCEDIVWVRTNADASEEDKLLRSAPAAPFTPTVQHCLMGIRGTIVRSTDNFFVHCNIDTDVILWPGEPVHGGRHGERVISLKRKPPELYTIAENFCLGTRRLELFGTNRNLRRGWLTTGLELGPDAPEWPGHDAAEPFDRPRYLSRFGVDPPRCPLGSRSNLLPLTEEVEQLRPKSPQTKFAVPAMPQGSTPPSQTRPHVPYMPTSPPQAGSVPSPWVAPSWQSPPEMRWAPQDATWATTYGAAPWACAPVPVMPIYDPNYPVPWTDPTVPAPQGMYPGSFPPGAQAPTPMPAPWSPPGVSPPGPRRRPELRSLIGQAAGGRERASVQSGSEVFSGAQAHVLQRHRRANGR